MEKTKGPMGYSRNTFATVVFSLSFVIFFLALVLINFREDDKFFLVALAMQKTLVVSTIAIIPFSIYCRSEYFWKFLFTYSVAGFAILFALYFLYSRGGSSISRVFESTLEDCSTYAKICALFTVGISIPVRYLYKTAEKDT